jgi:hypothetical protein
MVIASPPSTNEMLDDGSLISMVLDEAASFCSIVNKMRDGYSLLVVRYD